MQNAKWKMQNAELEQAMLIFLSIFILHFTFCTLASRTVTSVLFMLYNYRVEVPGTARSAFLTPRCRRLLPQMKQPLQCVKQTVRRALTGFVSEGFQRGMQKLVDDPLDGAFDVLSVLFFQVREPGK